MGRGTMSLCVRRRRLGTSRHLSVAKIRRGRERERQERDLREGNGDDDVV